MTKSISDDLRWRVIAAVDGGLSRRARPSVLKLR